MEESLIPNYNNHYSKIRRISDEIADFEMMIDYNGPEIGEADKLLMESLILHFKDNTKGIHFHTCNMFRSHEKTVHTILSRKSRFPLFK